MSISEAVCEALLGSLGGRTSDEKTDAMLEEAVEPCGDSARVVAGAFGGQVSRTSGAGGETASGRLCWAGSCIV